MPQEMGSRVEYPAEMQDAIASANAKLSVLRDETARLEEQKTLAYREVARLELSQDELIEKVARMNDEAKLSEQRLNDVSASLEAAKRELDIAISDKKVLDRDMSLIKEQITNESARLSSIVEDQRRAQEEMSIEKDAHIKMKELFEARKARVIELLGTI